MGSGNCSFWAPGVFDLDDDGIAIVLDPTAAATTRSSSPRRAARPRPSRSSTARSWSDGTESREPRAKRAGDRTRSRPRHGGRACEPDPVSIDGAVRFVGRSGVAGVRGESEGPWVRPTWCGSARFCDHPRMPIGITEEHEELRQAVRRFVDTNIPPAAARAVVDGDDRGPARVLGRAVRAGLARAARRRGARRRGLRARRAGRGGRGARARVRARPVPRDRDRRRDPRGRRRSGGRGVAAAARVGRVHRARSRSSGAPPGARRPRRRRDRVRDRRRLVRARRAPPSTPTELPSIDLTRRVARARPRRRDARPPIGACRASPPSASRDLAAVLFAAEAIGVAQWCVDTAAEYAKVRVQFGRPIGQFQGVKHRCADMLARTELARAAVWDAARAAQRPRQRRRPRDRGRGRARVRRRVPERQGLRADARRHRLHVGARRAPLPAPRDHAAPARRARPTSGACARPAKCRAARGAGSPSTSGRTPKRTAPRCARSSPRSRTSSPREQRDRLARRRLPHAGLAAAVGPRREGARAARDRRGVPRREGARAPTSASARGRCRP